MISRRQIIGMTLGISGYAAFTSCNGHPEMTLPDDKAAIDETRAQVFAAYRLGDVDGMMNFFHPEVIQIPAFERVLDGKEAVEANYRAILSRFDAALKDTLENMSIGGDMASTHGLYELVLTPRDGGAAVRRKGRYMVIMKQWDASPTGWSTFRELVQPAE